MSAEPTQNTNLLQESKIITILPLAKRPFFPSQTQLLMMNELAWVESIKEIGEIDSHEMGLFFAPNYQIDTLKTDDFANVGTLAKMRHPSLQEHKIQFIAEGQKRVKIIKWLSKKAPFKAEVEYLNDIRGGSSASLKAHTISIINIISQIAATNPTHNEDFKYFMESLSPDESEVIIDFAINIANASSTERQVVLEENNIKKRLTKVLQLLKKTLDIARIQEKIQHDAGHEINDKQRNFFLKEQLKVIQKELGINQDSGALDVEKYSKRLEGLSLPKHAKSTVDEQIGKLTTLDSSSAEYGVTSSYLDWLTSLPWGVFSKDKLNMNHAKLCLDKNHFGMTDVKKRILEFIAVCKLKKQIGGSIILLSGPPGVGKTSMGTAIAKALGREFYRFSLGGMRDEAEIKGHRRTYIGAMPGKLIHAFKQTKTQNPVIMLDEIDKIGRSNLGDPSSALLEVLDPEQNNNFLDHYLDTAFDLSKALFICTANDTYAIPEVLLDRMEVIEVSGYITDEKMEIAKQFLLPKQLNKAGLTNSQLSISDASIRQIIDGYAREAGVRNLEKFIEKVCRKTAAIIARNSRKTVQLSIKNIEEFLGKPVFDDDQLQNGVGIVTGLAWTGAGGATLTIESSLIHNKNRGFKLTGQLGDVMQESAEIAYSYVCSQLKKYHIKKDFFDEASIHLHVPTGATPKDGPSAGMAIASALVSLARGKKINRKLAMTGEITLTGKILPIGGLREKIIAAKRMHIFEVLLPYGNKKDFNELPKTVKKDIKVHFIKSFATAEKVLFSN